MNCAVVSKKHPRCPTAWQSSAFTLVEVMVAVAVVALFMSGMFALNSQSFQLLRSTQGVIAAEECTRDRLDKMRNAAFDSMVDPTYISGTVLTTTGNTFPLLDGLQIVLQVTSFPPPAAASTDAKTVIVTRNATGTVSVTKAGDGTLKDQTTVMVTATATWTGRGQTRTHEAYIIATSGGISGRND